MKEIEEPENCKRDADNVQAGNEVALGMEKLTRQRSDRRHNEDFVQGSG